MKVINKFLCFLSVFFLCVPLLCFNVSAVDSSELTYEEFFLSGGTGDLSGIEILSVDDNKQVSVPDNYFGCPILNEKFALFDITDSFSRFRCSFSRIFYYFKDSNDDNRDIYYIFRYGKRSDDFYYMTCHISFSPMSLASNNKIISDSEVFVSYIEYKVLPTAHSSTWTSSSVYLHGLSNRSTSSSTVLLCDDYVSVSSSIKFTDIQEVYSNCITEYNGNKVSERPKSSALKDNIEVKLSPEFGLDMDILNSSDDRFKFSVTNNTDKPIQFCVYIDEPGNDNSYLGDYVVNPAYTNALWNYKIDSYYYDIDITDNSKYLGFVVDNLISPVKCHGTIVWVYLDSGLTYSDYVYWKNVSLAIGKYYNINFLACYVPDNLDIVSNIFDVELLSDPIILSDFNSELRNDHWWTIDFLSKVDISDKMNSYKLSYEDVSTIYQAKFSLVSIPDYSSVSVGGNGIVSNGYKNDLSEFHEKDYSYNLDTGKEVFNSTGSFSNDFNMNDVSVDNVKNYISYCTDFFSLIKGTLSTFPEFIWVLIFFGLSAFVVIAIVKWIIS